MVIIQTTNDNQSNINFYYKNDNSYLIILNEYKENPRPRIYKITAYFIVKPKFQNI